MRSGFSLGIIILFCLCASSTAYAVEDEITTQVTQLKWPTLGKPASGSRTYIIHADGTADTGTGTKLYGTSSRGQYTLTKSGNGGGVHSITIDIQNINSGNANVTLSNFTGVYNGITITSFPRSGLPKPVNGAGTTLYLGATATYTGSVPVGGLTPSFNIVVTYQ